ncbi:hypothetical protein [Rathayibacter tanaceti]|nr:hypothetical protein [Rathayibacter tanaceti]
MVSTTPSAEKTALKGAIIPLQVSNGTAPINPHDVSDINGDLIEG